MSHGGASQALGVTIDVGPAVHQRAGLSRYTERLVAHLLALPQAPIAVSLFYNAHSGHQLPAALANTQQYTVRQGQLSWRLSALATQLLRWSLYETKLPASQLFHATEHLLPYLRRPAVLTVHDLIFERYPTHHTWRNRMFLRLAMPRFVATADAIIAVSRQTQKDLVEFYGTPADKIHILYEGIDSTFAPAPADEVSRVAQKYCPGRAGASRPYLLMVGTLEPRKNHATALRALARLKAAGYGHRLLVVGGEGWLFAPIRHLVQQVELEEDVSFTGYVPLADLVALYSGADCVLQPSLYEGFGFPVLEALACGAPVICSNSSSLPEVAGDAALLVPPLDVDGWAAAIQSLLATPALRASLREKGLRWAGQFRWERCAAETAALYREVASRGAIRPSG